MFIVFVFDFLYEGFNPYLLSACLNAMFPMGFSMAGKIIELLFYGGGCGFY